MAASPFARAAGAALLAVLVPGALPAAQSASGAPPPAPPPTAIGEGAASARIGWLVVAPTVADPLAPRAPSASGAGRVLAPDPAHLPALALPAAAYGAGTALPPGPRAALELEAWAPPSFEGLPGGVVLGLAARPEPALDAEGAALRLEGERVLLELQDGERLALPEASLALLGGALAVARGAGAAEVLVDVEGDGRVHLAPALVDTAAGAALVRADVAPRLFSVVGARGFEAAKSVLVDRDVRLVVDRARGEVRLEADLEARLYLPETSLPPSGTARRIATLVRLDGPRPRLDLAEGLEPADPELAAAVDEALAGAAEVARWTGFFRWAERAGVRMDELAAALAQVRDDTRTPRRVERRPEPFPAPARGAVPDWMRAHRAAVSGADRAAEGGGR